MYIDTSTCFIDLLANIDYKNFYLIIFFVKNINKNFLPNYFLHTVEAILIFSGFRDI